MKDHFAIVLLLLSLIASLVTVAQPINADFQAPQLQWSKTYGPYAGYAVIQTADGGYAIAGANATYGPHGPYEYSPLLIKTDASGEVEWSKMYAAEIGENLGAITSLVQTKDLGYAICGNGGWLLKLDANGNVQWTINGIPFTQAAGIQYSDDGYVLAGWSKNNRNGFDAMLIKTDLNGVLLWNRTFESSTNVYVYGLAKTGDGGYALTGQWMDGFFWLATTDSSGNLLINQTYVVSNDHASYSQTIAHTVDGGYILAGGDKADAWLIKVDSKGEMQWEKAFPDKYDNGNFWSVAQTVDEGYIAVGLFGNSDTWIVKTDSSGNAVWNQTFAQTFPNSTEIKTPVSLIVTRDGGYAVVGDIGDKVWLGKFAPESTVPSASPSTSFTPSNSPIPSPSIPEFPTWVVLSMVITATSLTIFLIRRKKDCAILP